VKRHSRLLRSSDFDRTLRSGRRAASDYLAVFVSDNDLGRPRVGLAVSRKLGNAVVRNRIKRRLRELVRPLVRRAEGGRDVVIVARARAAEAEFARLRQEIEMLWAKGWGR
jgi:ribonuclease P protein component